MMTIEEHLQVVFPTGAPAHIQDFFDETADHSNFDYQAVFNEIVESANRYNEEYLKLRKPMAELKKTLDETREGMKHAPRYDYQPYRERVRADAQKRLAELEAGPYSNYVWAESWLEIKRRAIERMVGRMSIAALVNCVCPAEARWMIPCLESGNEIGGKSREAIFQRRNILGEAEYFEKAARTRLLQIAEERSPTPPDFPKYL